MRRRPTVLLGLALLLGLPATQAIGAPLCGSPFVPSPTLQPTLANPNFSASDSAVDCFMWQTMVYLNWPATPGQRGVPNAAASLGSPGPSVWQTYKDYNELYLPNGQQPPAWNDNFLSVLRLQTRGVARALPSIRLLNSTSKVFRAANANESPALREIEQVGGGVLYDQAGSPVYYEMLVNEVNFDFIYNNQLYNPAQQNLYAKQKGIVLPSNSIEIKAAWKVLSAPDNPQRFLTAQALLPGSSTPVTVGLVGLHVFQMPSSAFNQGFWATFQQLDNAPTVAGATPGAHYSFNNPQCAPAQCPPNDKTSNPTQVVQNFPPTPEAQNINQYMQNLIAQQAPGSALQYYQLVDVQWPTSPQAIGQPGATAPAPSGTPNHDTLINPVLETFLQANHKSCLGCHVYASVAADGSNPPTHYQASFSFLLGHAKSPALGSNLKSLAQQIEDASLSLQH